MNILFTHGYFIKEDEKEQEIMRPYPPLGMLYISAWLEQAGMDNDVFDTTFSTKKELNEYLLQSQPSIIAIYTNLMTKLNVIEIVKFIRSTPALSESVVVLGGPDIRYNVKDYLATGANIAVIGEGEQTMLEIAQTVEKGNRTEFGHITGLAYYSADGELIQTAERSRIRPVDDLPYPNRKKIDIQQYLDTWKKYHGESAMTVSTQRGCPYTCKWCSTAVYGQSYRRRSAKLVVEELKYLQDTYNPDSIWFVDDVFTVSHKWLKEFRDEMLRQQVTVPFECITRADRMNEEVIQVIKEAGAFRLWIGSESGSQKIVDAMDRRVDVHHVRAMIRQTRAAGMQAGTFIMLGYPGETEADIKETVKHLKEANPDQFTITVAYPIKGTSLYNEIEAIQTKTLDWMNSTDRDRDFERTYSRKYYDYAVRWVVNEVHWHQQLVNKNWASLAAVKFKVKAWMSKVMMYYQRRNLNYDK
ncbi:MAG: radical SAM protein [Saprospiraceae bacterium]